MELALSTPALLFPAISLLLLAYTNRFLALANLMRDLDGRHRARPDPKILGQITNLKYRLIIIRNMQVFGVASFALSVVCMILVFLGQSAVATWIFAASLLLLLVSLILSLREIQVSIDALTLQVSDLGGPS